MTPSERERRIEAAASALWRNGFGKLTRDVALHEATRALDAADRAVPVVSEAEFLGTVAESRLPVIFLNYMAKLGGLHGD